MTTQDERKGCHKVVEKGAIVDVTKGEKNEANEKKIKTNTETDEKR